MDRPKVMFLNYRSISTNLAEGNKIYQQFGAPVLWKELIN